MGGRPGLPAPLLATSLPLLLLPLLLLLCMGGGRDGRCWCRCSCGAGNGGAGGGFDDESNVWMGSADIDDADVSLPGVHGKPYELEPLSYDESSRFRVGIFGVIPSPFTPTPPAPPPPLLRLRLWYWPYDSMTSAKDGSWRMGPAAAAAAADGVPARWFSGPVVEEETAATEYCESVAETVDPTRARR